MSIHINDLNAKKILVTGATSGIGQAIVKYLLNCGHYVIATGRDISKLSLLVDIYKENLIIKKLNFDDCNELESFHNEIDKIDGLVNAVGISEMLPAKLTEYENLLKIMHVNFLAPALLINKLLKKRKFNSGSSIVLISSISGVNISNIGLSSYAASKSALDGYIRSLALEIAPKIRINLVSPGTIETNTGMFADVVKKMSDEDIKRDLSLYPMGRFGKPEDIGGLVNYLLSSESLWVTGQNFIIDGGRSLK